MDFAFPESGKEANLDLHQLETGQPAFAFAAIDWNAAWSMPGIFAVTVRWTEVMEKPSPCR